jgi:hypothetical protein
MIGELAGGNEHRGEDNRVHAEVQETPADSERSAESLRGRLRRMARKAMLTMNVEDRQEDRDRQNAAGAPSRCPLGRLVHGRLLDVVRHSV